MKSYIVGSLLLSGVVMASVCAPTALAGDNKQLNQMAVQMLMQQQQQQAAAQAAAQTAAVQAQGQASLFTAGAPTNTTAAANAAEAAFIAQNFPNGVPVPQPWQFSTQAAYNESMVTYNKSISMINQARAAGLTTYDPNPAAHGYSASAINNMYRPDRNRYKRNWNKNAQYNSNYAAQFNKHPLPQTSSNYWY